VQEPDVRVKWVRAEPSPLQRLAWQRLWRLLLQGEPAIPEQDEPPLDVADERGGRKHGDGQA
jgi:hypothetical protein